MEGALPPPYPLPQLSDGPPIQEDPMFDRTPPLEFAAPRHRPPVPNIPEWLKRRRRGWTMSVGLALVFAAGIGLGVMVAPGLGVGQGHVEEKKLLDNEQVALYEFVFPPGFKGDEHEAPVNEF